MSTVQPEDENDEVVFRADLRGHSWRRTLLGIVLLGTVLGLYGWLVTDRQMAWHRVLLWIAVNTAVLGLWMLLPSNRTLLKEIRVRPDGFTIVSSRGTSEHRWSDLEAAYFEQYPVVNLGTSLRYFRFRTGGKNREVCLEGFDEPVREAFCAAVGEWVRVRQVPQRSPRMPTFDAMLSQTAAWLFAVGGLGLLGAHAFEYRTLGTLAGLTLMLTGVGMALMTRKEPLSRLVLRGAAALVLGSVAILWTCRVNVREALEKWEIRERRLGLPPWPGPQPVARPDREETPQAR